MSVYDKDRDLWEIDELDGDAWVTRREALTLLRMGAVQLDVCAREGLIRKRTLPCAEGERRGKVVYSRADIETIKTEEGLSQDEIAVLRSTVQAISKVLSEGLRKATIARTREERSAITRKWQGSKTPEQRSAIARIASESIPVEQRSANARKAGLASQISRTAEERAAAGKRLNASRTAEEKADAAKRMNAARTTEQRREAAFKARRAAIARAAANASASQ